jgi:hypothetical protein
MSDLDTTSEAPGGRRIVALMIVFTIAIGFDVVAIAGLAAVGGWWMLAMAFGVHLLASAIVLVEVADVIVGRTRWHRHNHRR